MPINFVISFKALLYLCCIKACLSPMSVKTLDFMLSYLSVLREPTSASDWYLGYNDRYFFLRAIFSAVNFWISSRRTMKFFCISEISDDSDRCFAYGITGFECIVCCLRPTYRSLMLSSGLPLYIWINLIFQITPTECKSRTLNPYKNHFFLRLLASIN